MQTLDNILGLLVEIISLATVIITLIVLVIELKNKH